MKVEAPESRFCGDKERFDFVKQVGQRFKHWHTQHENERREMDATIKRISETDNEHLDDAYQYPQPGFQATGRFMWFVDVARSQSLANICSANVYDVGRCNQDVICAVIKKSTTRSVINVDPDLVDSIPENDHLLYINSFGGKEPAFIQRNRDRWWDQQTSNSSTFYFSPQVVMDSTPSAGERQLHIYSYSS
jgi:hypothetical protein